MWYLQQLPPALIFSCSYLRTLSYIVFSLSFSFFFFFSSSHSASQPMLSWAEGAYLNVCCSLFLLHSFAVFPSARLNLFVIFTFNNCVSKKLCMWCYSLFYTSTRCCCCSKPPEGVLLQETNQFDQLIIYQQQQVLFPQQFANDHMLLIHV